jgi:transposase
MGEVSVIGLDLAKYVFQVHGADAAGRVVIRRQLGRAQVLEFFGRQARCLVAMEACSSAHLGSRTDQAGPRGAAYPAGLRQTLCEAAEE